MVEFQYLKKIELAEDISDIIHHLKYSPRPLTAKEIELTTNKSKNTRNVYRELKKLVILGVIKKVKFEVEGYQFVGK